jgi:hypothetical protein
MVILLLLEIGDIEPLGKKWLSYFKLRNADIKSLIGKRIEAARINGVSTEVLNVHFEHFNQLVSHLSVKSHNIWNMDETGTQLGACNNQIVLGSSHKKSTRIKTPNEREWVTAIETISAAGKKIRPLIVFKGQSVQLQWFSHTDCPDWLYTSSEKGWTSNEIGLQWLKTIFIPETQPEDKEWRILVVDGHGSHITVDFLFECHRYQIRPVFLPPHTSHCTQPLDLTCFSPIKTRYRAEIAQLASLTDSSKVKKESFTACYNKAREESLTERVIRNGFKAAGLVPFNPQAVLSSSHVVPPKSTTITPTKPAQKRLRGLNSPQTPTKFQHFKRQASKTRSTQGKRFLLKTAKQFDKINTKNVHLRCQIDQLNAQMKPLQAKQKKKKVVPSPDDTFINIETIKAAQDAQKRAEIAEETRVAEYAKNHPVSEFQRASQVIHALNIESMSFVFNLS